MLDEEEKYAMPPPRRKLTFKEKLLDKKIRSMEEEAGMPPPLPRKHVDLEDTEYFEARIRYLEKIQ